MRKLLEESDKHVHYFDFSNSFTGTYVCENDQTIYYKYVQFIYAIIYLIKVVLKIDQYNLSPL